MTKMTIAGKTIAVSDVVVKEKHGVEWVRTERGDWICVVERAE